MLSEKTVKGLKAGDRVFLRKGCLVKVRLTECARLPAGDTLGPDAMTLKLTASVCDEKGKALPREDGRYCVFPHAVTVPLAGGAGRDEDLFRSLEPVIESLIEKTIAWHTNVQAAESFVKTWRGKGRLKVRG